MNIPNETSIGNIGNYYGGLSVKAEEGKHYWSIEDYSGHAWQEIPESLYRSLLEYESQRKRDPENIESSHGGQEDES